jgi:hypothetical protein
MRQRITVRTLLSTLLLISALALPAAAQDPVSEPQAVASAAQDPAGGQVAGSPRPVAVEYSDAYELRRKIHVYASLATVPLFATQIYLGQKLYNEGPSDGIRSAHSVVGGAIGGLFAVNTVTGVWNLWEARHDSHGRTRRLIHGVSMLGADGLVAAASLSAPGDEGGGRRSLHRGLALTSMGVAAGSYVYMLLTR